MGIKKTKYEKREYEPGSLSDYEHIDVVLQVFGCVMNDLSLIVSHPLSRKDFERPLYKGIYEAIEYYRAKGSVRLTTADIDTYFSSYNKYADEYYKDNIGRETCAKALSFHNPENFEVNYETLKKLSLLREYKRYKFDISEIYEPTSMDIKNYEKTDVFNKMSFSELTQYYQEKLEFINGDSSAVDPINSYHAGGEEALQQFKTWYEKKIYGVGYASQALSTISKGLNKGKFTLISAATNTGKTRMTIANIGMGFANELYYKELGWVKNPHHIPGTKVLYIGTEMDPRTELEPILEAYIAEVPQDHIQCPELYEDNINDEYDENNETNRVLKAIKVMEESDIYWSYLPEYNFSTLEQTIANYKVKYGITSVFFDYVHVTASLIAEFKKITGQECRDDQVLQYLGNKLKDWSRTYNISIDTWTQVNGDNADKNSRDQRLIRGCKALADKADMCAIMMIPTDEEMATIQEVYEHGLSHNPYRRKDRSYEGRLRLSVYKNRNSKYKNVDILLAVDFETMRVLDCGVTDPNGHLLEFFEILDYRRAINENGEYTIVPVPLLSRKGFKESFQSLVLGREAAMESRKEAELDMISFKLNHVNINSNPCNNSVDLSDNPNEKYDSDGDPKLSEDSLINSGDNNLYELDSVGDGNISDPKIGEIDTKMNWCKYIAFNYGDKNKKNLPYEIKKSFGRHELNNNNPDGEISFKVCKTKFTFVPIDEDYEDEDEDYEDEDY